MATSKPDLANIWANSSALIANPGAAKQDTGWVLEKPQVEYVNWLINKIDTYLHHIGERGVGVWDATTEYDLGSITIGSNGVMYRSLTADPNQGNDPISDVVNWAPWEATGGVSTPSYKDQEFLTSGTWTRPVGHADDWVRVILVA
ncbi:MAG: hypothetical protein DRJ03_03180, partial [Chloroflexi bacterium]